MSRNPAAEAVRSQLVAALHTLRDCISRCPDTEWHEKHGDYPFSQVVFHVLFDCDLILSKSEDDLKDQPFHKMHIREFGRYEELDGKTPSVFNSRDFMDLYWTHVREKTDKVLSSTVDSDILKPDSDIYECMTANERHINMIRHTQHHTAQLGFRLQLMTGAEMEWIGRAAEVEST